MVPLAVELLELIGVGVGPVRSEFVVATLRPESSDQRAWFDAAKAMSATSAVASLVELLDDAGIAHGVIPPDERPVVLLAAYHEGSREDRETFAAHLATRAPLTQPLWRSPELTGVVALSEHHCRFVTPRITGFVVEAGGGADHFETKFLSEMSAQYLLGVVLTLWQREWMEQMLDDIQATWEDTEGDGRRHRSDALRRRLTMLRSLRHRHAVLITSGTFGPVFGAGSQAMFWDELQARFDIQRRRSELDEALSALGSAAEIQASANLERLLGFFTLVVGVPSLVFAVLGVNINKVTSEADGVPVVFIVGLFVACLIIGAGAFMLTSGWFSAGRQSTVDRIRRRDNDDTRPR